MEADNRRAISEIQKRGDEKNGSAEDVLATTQKNIENTAGKVVHRTKAQQRKIMITPENARLREERCTRKIKRRILRKQARKARAEHLVKGRLEPGKRKTERKPLTEVFVKEKAVH